MNGLVKPANRGLSQILNSWRVNITSIEHRSCPPAHDNTHTEFFGLRLQPRSQVYVLADYRIVHPLVTADVADQHLAGIDSHPDAQRMLAFADHSPFSFSTPR